MIGTFESFELAFGSFGQQYATIDGKKYITFFDLASHDRVPGGSKEIF